MPYRFRCPNCLDTKIFIEVNEDGEEKLQCTDCYKIFSKEAIVMYKIMVDEGRAGTIPVDDGKDGIPEGGVSKEEFDKMLEEEPSPKEEEEEEIEEEEIYDGPIVNFSTSIKDPSKVLSFYEKVSTFEDAEPYIDDSLLVVADGTGGAGGFYHYVKKSSIDNYDKVKKIILREDVEDCLKDHMMKLWSPIFNEEKEELKKTSAYFASRIVLPRFIFAMKYMDHNDLEGIKDFIIDGLTRFANKLDLYKDTPSNRDKSLLPTTLVAININEEREDEIDIDVYWAGDSRAYYLTTNGIKQLSKDDEREEAITNYFTLKESVKVELKKKHYVLKKPGLLFVCSDGIFDAPPFPDHLSLELGLIQLMVEKDSMEGYKENLMRVYNAVKCDDSTMAMRMFGYSSYKEMKEAFKPRFDHDAVLYNEKKKYKTIYDVKGNPNIYKNNVNRLNNRAKDVFLDIVNDLLKEENRNDPLYKLLIEEIKNDYLKEVELTKKKIIEKKEEIIELIKKYLQDNYSSIDFDNIFKEDLLSHDSKELLMKIKGALKGDKRKEELLASLDREKQFLSSLQDDLWIIVEETYKRVSNALGNDIEELDADAFKERNKDGISEEVEELLLYLDKIKFATEYNEELTIIKNLEDEINNHEDKDITSLVRSSLEALFALNDVDTLFEAISNSDPNIIDIKDKMNEIDDSILNSNYLIKMIQERVSPELIVEERLKLPAGTRSVIDHNFNTALLTDTLKYHSAIQVDDKEIEDFKERYQAFEKAAEEYIS